MIIQINGVDVDIRGLDGNEEHRQRVVDTLSLVPSDHLKTFRYYRIRQSFRENYAGGSNNWVDNDDHSQGVWILIDPDGFDPRQREINNRPPNFYNYTVLHELGHAVDRAYRGMRWVRRNDRSGYRAMMRHPHPGDITTGAGEHFADAYADFFFYSESERATDERMEALLASPAFDGLGVSRRE